jgi:hypothetical protein
LDDHQIGRESGKRRKNGPADVAYMDVRIFLARTAQPDRRIGFKAVVGGLELRMLAGEDDVRRQAACGERRGDRRQLDCFRTCSDDQTYTTGQLSP